MIPPRRAFVCAIAVLAAPLAGCDRISNQAAPRFHGVDITGGDLAPAIAMPDTEGRPRTLADFRGKVTVVFFGYTQCPDVCPSTLAELAELKRGFGRDGDRLQVVFVSVDPERDTPAALKGYVGGFDPSFVALRGSPEQTAAAAKSLKLYYAKVPGKQEGAYTIDHTAGSYVFDSQGRVRLFVRYGTPAAALRQDLEMLLRGA